MFASLWVSLDVIQSSGIVEGASHGEVWKGSRRGILGCYRILCISVPPRVLPASEWPFWPYCLACGPQTDAQIARSAWHRERASDLVTTLSQEKLLPWQLG